MGEANVSCALERSPRNRHINEGLEGSWKEIKSTEASWRCRMLSRIGGCPCQLCPSEAPLPYKGEGAQHPMPFVPESGWKCHVVARDPGGGTYPRACPIHRCIQRNTDLVRTDFTRLGLTL